MELLVLLTERDEIASAVRNCLKGYSIYAAKNTTELDELLFSISASLLILDGFSVRPAQVEAIMSIYQHQILLLTEGNYNLHKLSRVAETIDIKDISDALPRAVERIIDRENLENEIKILRESHQKYEQLLTGQDSPQVIDSPTKRLMHEQVLLNFAKTLTANFDMKKLLSHFMDSVMEIIRVNKMSIMLREKNIFKIRAHIGMDPNLAENIKLTTESSLVKWLAGHGRILSKTLNSKYLLYPDILKEMELFQCIFSFPMTYKGKLIGIFNIDNKITGDPFYKEELEVIFILCSYLSAAIKDIDSYHQIQYQKEFTKNILANMSSGVITINPDERISIFNQRASEILKLNAMDIIGSDLRKLPSPLGDILYETMSEGKSYSRHEIAIKPGNIPLGINSYRILDENKTSIGAVIVFTDLSDLKKLEKEKRKAEKLEAVNNLIAKIAHEIKNPLTSIRTFTQLLEEKYADEEFRKFFAGTVMRSIQQLNNLIDKLVLFSSPLDHRPARYSVNQLIDNAAAQVRKDLPPDIKFMKENMDKDIFVNVDRNLFIKALYYLILASAEKSLKGNSVLLQAMENNKSDTVEISVKFSGRPLTEEDRETLFKPLLDMDAFGVELNIPISHKIIEEQNGALTIAAVDGFNAFIISLPAIIESGIAVQKDNLHGH